MTKKVKARSWSLDKFTASVKRACERAGVKFQASKVKRCYEENFTVANTVATFAK